MIFAEEDDERVVFSHNDTVVITLNIKNYDVRHVFINNGSSANILYFNTLIKMRISPNQLTEMNFPLIRFTRDAILVERTKFPILLNAYQPHELSTF